MTVSFTATDAGLAVVDAAEQRQCLLATPEPARTAGGDPHRFVYPVDDAVVLRTAALTLATQVTVYVRDADGGMCGEVERFGSREFPAGEYEVELCAPIKLYLGVEGPLTVESTADGVAVRSAGERVHVGARSHHERPEFTVTTTGDPRDLMRAISTFGSALKTVSPERSFPTLRGHPPELRVGDELSIPEGLAPPPTGIALELPLSRESIYPAAPLAYYLGATVEPGAEPRLVADGVDHALDGGPGYEHNVARLLKRVFLLDCLTRTEGFYRVELHAREALEPRLDLDFAALYDATPAERLRAYLSVPHAAVADRIPEWKLTAHVPPEPDAAELLPFLVDDLAVVRLPQADPATASEPAAAAIDEFTREFTRGATRGDARMSLVDPPDVDSLEQAWAGEAVPLGASKVSVEAFRNRLARDRRGQEIDITVVCNDDAMDEEQDLAAEVYGSREDLPFDVRVYRDLSTAALRAVIETDADFLHYIGHIDREGFACADGKLDVGDLDGVGVDAFFLNACTSYEQGMALIERGAIGGIATLTDVLNSGAVRVGRTIVRLLNGGFPLRAALTVASDRSVVGGEYTVVGDGNVDVVQSDGGPPVLVRATGTDAGFDLDVRIYPAGNWQPGAMCQVLVEGADERFLVPGRARIDGVDPAAFREFLAQENLPVVLDGEFYWAEELLADRL